MKKKKIDTDGIKLFIGLMVIWVASGTDFVALAQWLLSLLP